MYNLLGHLGIAFRENGQGYAAMTTFCRCMIIPPPMMAQTTFHKLNSDLHNAYVQTALSKNQWQKLQKLFTIIIYIWDSFVITNQGSRYYQIGQLLQIGAKCITNWGRYYKLGQLLQIGA